MKISGSVSFRKSGRFVLTFVGHHEIFKFLHLDEEEKKPNSEIAGTHVGAIKETPVKAEKPKTVEKSTETEKTAKTTAEKKPATRRRGRPKKTQ